MRPRVTGPEGEAVSRPPGERRLMTAGVRGAVFRAGAFRDAFFAGIGRVDALAAAGRRTAAVRTTAVRAGRFDAALRVVLRATAFRVGRFRPTIVRAAGFRVVRVRSAAFRPAAVRPAALRTFFDAFVERPRPVPLAVELRPDVRAAFRFAIA